MKLSRRRAIANPKFNGPILMLSRRIAHGAIWLVSARLAVKLFDFLSVIVLARFLLPNDFGLATVAVTVLIIVNSVTELPIGNALVHLEKPTEGHYDTAFTIGLIRGILVSTILVALAEPIAWLYDDQRLAPVIWLLALSPLVRGAASPKTAVFLIELRYLPQFLVEVSGKLVGVIVAIVLAITTESYWAMVSGIVIAPIVSTIASYVLAPGRFRLRLAEWRSILDFTSWLTLSQMVNTLNWQSDRLFVGGVLSKATLGQYVVGSEMASTSTYAIVGPIIQTLFTGMMKVRDSADRLKQAYLLSQQVVMAFVMPIGIALSLLTNPLGFLLLGPEWGEAVLVIQVTAPIFSIQMLTAPAFSVVMTLGRTKLIFLRDLLGLVLRLPMVLIAASLYGLPGVVGAIVVAELIIIYLNLSIVSQLIGVGVVRQVAAPWRTLLSVLAMAAVLGVAKLYQPPAEDALSAWIFVALSALLGGLTYLLCHFGLWFAAGRPEGPETKVFQIIGVRSKGH